MVYLYKNKLPNYAENTHVFFNDVNKYVAYLGSAFLQFTEDRYTMNGNIAEIQLPAVTDFDDVTYIAWNNGGAWRFFFVRSAVYQSGYAIFTLDVDLWATYISKASFSKIHVKRCNRNIGVGVYDDIAVTAIRSYTTKPVASSLYVIAYTVAIETNSTSLFANNASTTVKQYANIIGVDQHIKSVDEAIAYVSGIYAVTARTGEKRANILNAYILPYNAVKIKDSNVPTFKVSTDIIDGDLTLIPSFEVDGGTSTFEFVEGLDPDYLYIAGTKHSGIELPRLTRNINFRYDFISLQNGFSILISVGEKSVDITQSFEVALTLNDGNITSQERIARQLSLLSGFSNATFQVMSGGAGYITGALQFAETISSAFRQSNASIKNSGDGKTTFSFIDDLDESLRSPLVLQMYKSIQNEKEKARVIGVNFDEFISSFDTLFNASLMGTGELSDTYIVADVVVTGIPADANDIITSDLRAGVYAVKI